MTQCEGELRGANHGGLAPTGSHWLSLRRALLASDGSSVNTTVSDQWELIHHGQNRDRRRSVASLGSPLRVTKSDGQRLLGVYARRRESREDHHRIDPKSRDGFDVFHRELDQSLSFSGSIRTISSDVQITGMGIKRSVQTCSRGATTDRCHGVSTRGLSVGINNRSAYVASSRQQFLDYMTWLNPSQASV